MINTKKVNAVILALIIVFSMCVPAFAEGEVYKCEYCGAKFDTADELKTHKTKCVDNPYNATQAPSNEAGYVGDNFYTCPGCGQRYSTLAEYNKCISSHNYGVDTHWDDYISMTLPELLDWALNWFNNLIAVITGADNDDTFGIASNISDILLAITNNIVALISGVSTGNKADVAGAVDDLDASVKGIDFSPLGLDSIHSVIDTIKVKVKDFYAGEKETAVELTVAEAPAETGSANIGIAAFAAISVAAAAAFVCTKKKEA